MARQRPGRLAFHVPERGVVRVVGGREGVIGRGALGEVRCGIYRDSLLKATAVCPLQRFGHGSGGTTTGLLRASRHTISAVPGVCVTALGALRRACLLTRLACCAGLPRLARASAQSDKEAEEADLGASEGQ